jgi:hypothetical protein
MWGPCDRRAPYGHRMGMEFVSGGWWTWRRPTLPRLETQYHWRGGFSRPSSGWDRVRAPRYDHQVDQPPEGSGCRCGRCEDV